MSALQLSSVSVCSLTIRPFSFVLYFGISFSRNMFSLHSFVNLSYVLFSDFLIEFSFVIFACITLFGSRIFCISLLTTVFFDNFCLFFYRSFHLLSFFSIFNPFHLSAFFFHSEFACCRIFFLFVLLELFHIQHLYFCLGNKQKTVGQWVVLLPK